MCGGFGSTGRLYGSAAAKRAPGIADSENQIMVAEYCEKCLSPLHRLIGVRSTGIVCNEEDFCRILINGEEVDVSHLFAENADGREENIGYAVGCPDALLYNPRYLNFER